MNIKMIVTDLDGTLLTRKKRISSRTKEVLIKAQEQGMIVVLATGRNYHNLEKIYKELKMDVFKTGAIIGVNGQELYYFKTGHYEKKRMLTALEAMKLLRFGHRYMFEVLVMNDHQILDCISPMIKWCKAIVFKLIHKKVNETFEGRMENHQFIDVHHKINHEVNKVGFSQLPAYTSMMLPYLKKVLSKHYEVLMVSKGWIEIMPKGINKGSGLKQVMEHFDIKEEEVLIFGDGENDMSMLEGMPHSYAMENALESVKKVAKYVCGTNELDGLAKVVEKYIECDK